MLSLPEDFAWRFGGLLAGQDLRTAWTVLGATALLGLVLIALSYHYSLVRLSLWKKITLTGLRFLLLLLILVLLAGPVRIIKRYSRQHDEAPRPLALLVDRSESMKMADNRHQIRADDARRRWLAIEPEARKAFSEIQTYAFARGFERIPGLDSPSTVQGDQTELYSALQRTMAEAPAGGWGGLVTLTDAVDTSSVAGNDEVESLVHAALGTGTRLYFVPGRNRYAGKSFFSLRAWNMPGKLAPRSTFQLEVTIDSFQSVARSVPLRLRVGNQQKPTETLRLESGRRLFTWTVEIATDSVGVLPVELQLGDGEQAITARAEIRVEAPSSNRILYYQGALDWGYKFLGEILRDDPEFSFTPILTLAPNGRDNLARAFPGTAAGLQAYDIIVLANAEARQFSNEQQTTITEWVKNGGVLLFLAPDDAAAQGYSGSELEKMLPVVFSRPSVKADTQRAKARNFIRSFGDGGSAQEIGLSEFAWEEAARQIFGEGKFNSPKFSSYAHVLRAKPGAEVLARHPRDLSPEGGDEGRAILLALQRYGRGQSAVLTSDALWRWKLNQASTEHGAEKFWRHLFSWLGRDRVRDLTFDHAPLTAAVGQEISLHLLGAGTLPIQLEAGTNQQKPATIMAYTDAKGVCVYRWRPPSAGDWELVASEENGRVAKHWLRVLGEVASGEASGVPVDEVLMARLAERTGGAVLDDTAPEQWVTPRGSLQPEIISEQFVQLWHHRYVLAALVTVYALELLLRRRWYLL